MSGMIWANMNAAERVQEIQVRIDKGMSGTMIAQVFKDNPSRSAILGFCRRQGLRLISDAPRLRINPKKAPAPKPRKAKPVEPVFTSPDPMNFMSVTKLNRCRWPLFDRFEGPEESLFCGAEKMDGVSYCRHHHERSRVKE